MSVLADYAGIPIDTRLATDFKLISSLNISNPILDFQMGTAIKQAMETITKESSSLFYINRFGILIHVDSETSTGTNWSYPDIKFESFSDEPDFQFMRNEGSCQGTGFHTWSYSHIKCADEDRLQHADPGCRDTYTY